jgi:hypothetical protein
MPEKSGNVSPEDIEAAQQRYPDLPAPLSVARYLLDKEMENPGRFPLQKGSAWGGVHLERVGVMVQKLAEAVYHQYKKSITIKLTATDYPETYDHWGIEITEVEGGAPGESTQHPLFGWPCCSCGKPIQNDDTTAAVAMLDKLAKWQYPTWGNVLAGTGGRAMAVLCGSCSEARKAPDYAIKRDGKKFIRVSLKELEDINGRPR